MDDGDGAARGAAPEPAAIEAVLTGMADWQAAHPTAPLADIEAEVEARLAVVRAQMLEQALVRAARQQAEVPAIACPQCGGALQARGQPTRTMRLRGDRTVSLRRSYQTCAACGHGLFPPG
jgi:hypothetical protein